MLILSLSLSTISFAESFKYTAPPPFEKKQKGKGTFTFEYTPNYQNTEKSIHKKQVYQKSDNIIYQKEDKKEKYKFSLEY